MSGGFPVIELLGGLAALALWVWVFCRVFSAIEQEVERLKREGLWR